MVEVVVVLLCADTMPATSEVRARSESCILVDGGGDGRWKMIKELDDGDGDGDRKRLQCKNATTTMEMENESLDEANGREKWEMRC